MCLLYAIDQSEVKMNVIFKSANVHYGFCFPVSETWSDENMSQSGEKVKVKRRLHSQNFV